MYWQQASNVANCAVSDLIGWNKSEDILRYLHQANNAEFTQGDKLVKTWPFCNTINQKFLKVL